jgi:serpin B
MKNSLSGSAAILLSTAALMLFSCKKDNEIVKIEPVPINLTADQVALVDSGNSFAIDIFKKVAESEQPSKNLVISPLSISVALSMALNGANGETRAGMIEVLRSGGLSPANINDSYKSLSHSLLNVDNHVKLTIANSIWAEKKFPVKVPFKNVLTEYYNAEARSFDINDAGVPGDVNNWIDSKTNGLIKNMIDDLDPATVMLLINAIYFKGQWNSQFEKSNTVDEPFHVYDTDTKQVPMMKQKTDFNVYKAPGFTLAEFPYGQGNFVMDVLLPDDINGVNGLIKTMTIESFNEMISKLHSTEVELSFPRFKYGYKKTLNEILSDMGMSLAFTENADFSNLSDVAVYISFVLHQAFIETNEEGTEAAAATIVGFYTTSMPAGPLVLKLDHPFLYVIRETTTNSILFMGRVANPLEQ